MPEFKDLLDALNKFGPYWIVVISLQFANVTMQVGCFKQIMKLSEQFSHQLSQLVESLRKIDEKYLQLQQEMCKICEAKQQRKTRGDSR